MVFTYRKYFSNGLWHFMLNETCGCRYLDCWWSLCVPEWTMTAPTFPCRNLSYPRFDEMWCRASYRPQHSHKSSGDENILSICYYVTYSFLIQWLTDFFWILSLSHARTRGSEWHRITFDNFLSHNLFLSSLLHSFFPGSLTL